MKNLRLLLSFLLGFESGAVNITHAAFEDRGVGARGSGMGEVQTGVADDVNAVHYNPAGLIQVVQPELGSEYGQFAPGLGDGSTLGQTYVGYAHPVQRGYRTFGGAFTNFAADNLFTERT